MNDYAVSKLNVNNSEYRSYERTADFSTAAEMFNRIKYWSQNDNGWFYGRGSHIIMNGDVIATLSDYEMAFDPQEDPATGRIIRPTPSIKKLLEYRAELDEMEA